MKARLDSIQFLRAIAVLSVVLYHIERQFSRIASPENPLPGVVSTAAWLGNAGVDIFFVISGFIMMYMHHDDFAKPGTSRRFIVNRLARILPSYWVLTTVALITLIFFSSVFHYDRSLDWYWIAASYLFVPWRSTSGIDLPLLGLGWTLNYEMYFYLLFALLLPFKRTVAILALGLLFALSIAFGQITGTVGPFGKMLTSWLLLEFFGGMLLGVLSCRGLILQAWTRWVFVLSALAILVIAPSVSTNASLPGVLRFAFFGCPGMLLVASFTLPQTMSPPRFPAWCTNIGNISYSLYLTHVFTLPLCALVLRKLSWGGLHFVLYAAILLSATLLVAQAFHILFERPVLLLFRRLPGASALPPPLLKVT